MRMRELYLLLKMKINKANVYTEEIEELITNIAQLSYAEGFIDGIKLNKKKHAKAYGKIEKLIINAAEDSDCYSAVEEAERILKEL